MSGQFRNNIEQGYADALKLAKSHYENFPVVSLLVPKKLQKHIAVVYWFARTADDFADEGNLSGDERMNSLIKFEQRFTCAISGESENFLEIALAETIKTKNLNPNHFLNLLKAFKQDVTKKRYNNFDEVLDYCKHSANPVGRIILELFDIRDPEAFAYSDRICTALQLTNFLQDSSIDFERGRIYYPVSEMEKFGVEEKLFEIKENNHNFQQLVEYNLVRIERLFDEGKNLFPFLNGRLKIEVVWTVYGGQAILNKIRRNKFDVLNSRQSLSRFDNFKLIVKSVLKR